MMLTEAVHQQLQALRPRDVPTARGAASGRMQAQGAADREQQVEKGGHRDHQCPGSHQAAHAARRGLRHHSQSATRPPLHTHGEGGEVLRAKLCGGWAVSRLQSLIKTSSTRAHPRTVVPFAVLDTHLARGAWHRTSPARRTLRLGGRPRGCPDTFFNTPSAAGPLGAERGGIRPPSSSQHREALAAAGGPVWWSGQEVHLSTPQ